MTLEYVIKRLEELKKKRHNLLDEISLKAMALAAKDITVNAYSDWLTEARDRLSGRSNRMSLRLGPW